MTEGFEIKVPITLKGGREGEKVGRQIGDKIASQMTKALKTIGIGDKRGMGMTQGGTGTLGFLAKGITKMTGLLAIAAIALDSLYTFVKPVLDLLKTIFLLLFMPLIPILKPVMILLGEMAKVLGPVMAEISKSIDALMKPFSEMIQTTFAELGQPIQDLAVAIIQIFSSLIQALPSILPMITKFLQFLGENLAKIVPIIIDALMWAGNFLVSGWNVIKDALDWVGNFFLSSWNTIKEILDWIGTWLQPIWDSIKTMLDNAYEGVKEKWGIIIDFLDGIASALEVIKGIFDAFNPFGGAGIIGKILGFARGGVVPGQMGKPQLAIVHGGEEVTPRGSSRSVILQPTFNFTGPISQSIDIDELARRTGKITEMELKQRGII